MKNQTFNKILMVCNILGIIAFSLALLDAPNTFKLLGLILNSMGLAFLIYELIKK